MKTKLSFAQRLQKQSLSKEKPYRKSTSLSEKKSEAKPVKEKERFLNFKQQHNELKSMLRMFQNPKAPQLPQSSQLIPTTPIRTRRADRKLIIKNQQKPQILNKAQALKENFMRSEWPISLKDTFQSNGSLILPKSSPCIPESRGALTPRSRNKLIKKGIHNNGNTCYINAIVQCLFHLPHFNDYFVDRKYQGESNNKKKDVVDIYRSLFIDVMQNREDIDISTLPLKKSVSKICMLFIDWEQEDAHQFMKQLLNSIHEELNRNLTKPKYKTLTKQLQGNNLDSMAATFWDHEKLIDNSYIYDCLCGQIYNNIKCINCTHESQGFQNFLDLSLPMVPHASSLEDLLDQFFEPEKLSDFYLCNQCGKSSKKSTKTLQLWRVPRFLIIHLKRSQFGKKNTDPIKIPESLSLKSYMTISSDKSARYCQYNLCGIIMHQGVIEGGHYWCNVKESGKWYEIDDDKVRDINREEFKKEMNKTGSSNAYILFYSSLYS